MSQLPVLKPKQFTSVGFDTFLTKQQLKELPSTISKLNFEKADWGFPHPFVPAINPKYLFTKDRLMALLPYIVNGKGQIPWLWGPFGSGKTSYPREICARLGKPVREIYVSETTEVIDLGGQYMPTKDGGMEFIYGTLVKAMQEGSVLLINEFDLMNSNEQKALNQVFEERRFTIIQKDETIVAHPEFRIIVTANSNGTGAFGNTLETEAACSSVGDRFYFIFIDYLNKDEEMQILMAEAQEMLSSMGYTGEDLEDSLSMAEHIGEVMITYANDVRSSYKSTLGLGDGSGAGLPAPLSHRTLIEWYRKSQSLSMWYEVTQDSLHNTVTKALEMVFISGQRPDTHANYMQAWKDRAGNLSVF
ncbi:AAA family ATPase [Photobacterium lutimaris]|uniref:ATPase dynein-related AAA domain-containing protein n=1 Tax=Photobacterium lutimaris TaxID=388278 RepID=A0A2T3ITU7_9GAMM|nr:MoxR family ATPase [Photobacterium lutimaris]PSU31784.1 hypothetical protein C9I99_21610 [Photobacterium lutimaris]TDR72563.1 dynein-related subfamily AAA family protein [Photobacterium lutimaris]